MLIFGFSILPSPFAKISLGHDFIARQIVRVTSMPSDYSIGSGSGSLPRPSTAWTHRRSAPLLLTRLISQTSATIMLFQWQVISNLLSLYSCSCHCQHARPFPTIHLFVQSALIIWTLWDERFSRCNSMRLAAGAGFSIVGWVDKPWGRVLSFPHTEIMVGKGLIKGWYGKSRL